MNKTIPILIISILIFSVLISAQPAETFWWEFEGNYTDKVANITMTESGGVDFRTGHLGNNASNFDGLDDALDAFSISDTWTHSTISMWIFTDLLGTTMQVLQQKQDSSAGGHTDVRINSDNSSRFAVDETLSGFENIVIDLGPGGADFEGNWRHFVMVMETGGTHSVYLDGTLTSGNFFNGPASNRANQYNLGREDGNNVLWFDGAIDDLRIFNDYDGNWSQAHTNALYNSGAGTTQPLADLIDIIEITLDFPSENLLTANANPIDVNYTIIANNPIDNVTIFINGTLNKTVSGGGNTTLDIGEGTFTMTVTATDNTSLVDSDTVSSFKIDRTTPFDDLTSVITPGVTIFENQNFSITASNINLFGHNVTVWAPNGSIAFSQEVLNISEPNNVITIPVDVISYGTGTFIVFSNESDDHTDNIIEWNTIVDTANKRLTYETGDEDIILDLEVADAIPNAGPSVNILPTLTGIQNSVLADRFNFGFSFPASPPSFTYHYEILVTSTEEIFQRDTEFEGHLVTGGVWIDFVADGFTYSDFSIDRIDKFNVRVIIDTDSPAIDFKSIGGVNQGGSESNFIISDPVINNFNCDTGSFDQCQDLTDLQSLQQTQIDCSFGDSAIISLFKDSIPVFIDQVAIQAGDLYTFDNINEPIEDGGVYLINATCTSELGNTTDQLIFNGLPPSGQTLSGFDANTFLSHGVVVLIIIFFTVFIIRGFKK